jgi:hypothetical protein
MRNEKITGVLGFDPGRPAERRQNDLPNLPVASWAVLVHNAPGRNGRGYTPNTCS